MKRFLLIIIAAVMICTSCGSKEESSSSATEVSLNDSSVEDIDDLPYISEYSSEIFIDYYNETMQSNERYICMIKKASEKKEDVISGVFKGKEALIYETDGKVQFKFYVSGEKFYGLELLLNEKGLTDDNFKILKF